MSMGMLLLDGWFKLEPGEGAFYAVFGFLFVFAGIALLIGIIKLVGIIMTKLDERHEKRSKRDAQQADVPLPPAAPEIEEGISPEVVAAITAAIAVCLSKEKQRCEFVVRRIKKI